MNEGDNLHDGVRMASVLSESFRLLMGGSGLVKEKLRIPFAYDHVYGPEPDAAIYT